MHTVREAASCLIGGSAGVDSGTPVPTCVKHRVKARCGSSRLPSQTH